MIEAGTSKPAPFDVVVVHSFSRFFRDHFELEFYVRKLAKNGVRLISITQDLGDDPMSVMMRQILTLFDEYQSKENAKHTLRAKHYIRYVDDFIFLHESPDWLNQVLANVHGFLIGLLRVQLNHRKTILQPIERGVDFVGQVIKPWRRTTRRRTVAHALQRIEHTPTGQLLEVGNSYFGLLGQASHSHTDRAKLANALRRRGHSISASLIKAYRRPA